MLKKYIRIKNDSYCKKKKRKRLIKSTRSTDEIERDIKVASSIDDLKKALLDIIQVIDENNYDENLAEMESKIDKMDERLDSTNERINKLPGADAED